jgi:hypothetical protein
VLQGRRAKRAGLQLNNKWPLASRAHSLALLPLGSRQLLPRPAAATSRSDAATINARAVHTRAASSSSELAALFTIQPWCRTPKGARSPLPTAGWGAHAASACACSAHGHRWANMPVPAEDALLIRTAAPTVRVSLITDTIVIVMVIALVLAAAAAAAGRPWLRGCPRQHALRSRKAALIPELKQAAAQLLRRTNGGQDAHP